MSQCQFLFGSETIHVFISEFKIKISMSLIQNRKPSKTIGNTLPFKNWKKERQLFLPIDLLQTNKPGDWRLLSAAYIKNQLAII